MKKLKNAARLGFDYIGTTLHGYTSYTQGQLLYQNDFQFLKDVLQSVDAKVIAEGNVITPDMYKRVMDLGVHCSSCWWCDNTTKRNYETFCSNYGRLNDNDKRDDHH